VTTTWEGLGQRLRLAREQAGFTQQEAASELGVTAAALSQYEAGKRGLDALALDRLARLYGVPVAFMLGQDQPQSDWETALRGRARDLSTAGKRGISELVEKVHQFEELFRVTDTPFPGPSHPPFEPLPAQRMRDQEIAAWAEKSRRHFDIGIAPLAGIRDFLAAQGYQIFSIALGDDADDLSGLFFQHPELGPIIALNEDKAYTRRPFTLAHELAHGLFHYDRPAILCRGRSHDPLEFFADRFAAQFLVPGEALQDRLRDLQARVLDDPDDVIHLARYFGVSYGAMRWRLAAERRLAQPDDPRWDIAPVARARQLGYSVTEAEFGKRPLPLEERFPRDYLDTALRAVRDERLSLRRVAELLDVSHLELEELLAPEEQRREQLEEAYA
jgi:Zn-dependent peptidase ImmA (M78 family)/DNA-binding XRE family transcriptional regulator